MAEPVRALQRQGQWVDGFWMQKIDSLNPGIEDMRGQSADNGFQLPAVQAR